MCKFKKAIAVMLSAVMMLSVGAMPITVNADTIEERNTYGFSVYDDFLYDIVHESSPYAPGVYIYEYIGTNTEVVVPSEINGMSVVAISGDRPFKDNMTSIILPNTIVKIGRGTFRNCKSLKSIVIPDSVTIIIDEAFIGCTALESVVFGHGISTIGDIFQGCTSLKSVTIPNNVTHIYETALLYHKSDFFIYGYKGSYAETYAKENDVQFKMIHVKGDIDLDGLATIHDVTLIQRYCADEIETIEAPVNYVDVDGNDSIDINDATAIQRLLVE